MPKGMQEAGTAMHHAASRFAITAQNAAINDDVGRALGELNEVTQACRFMPCRLYRPALDEHNDGTISLNRSKKSGQHVGDFFDHSHSAQQ